MPDDESSPTFDFFRATPCNMAGLPPLVSSLQSFETSLFLIGLDKYPSALIACSTAWESALKAKLAIGLDDRVDLYELLNRIRAQFTRLGSYDSKKLKDFRTTRNRLVHYGFSPRDDELSAMLLVETGFPFLNFCYQELFDFYLDWQEIKSDKCEFHELTSEEIKKAGLVPEVAAQFRFI